MQIQLDGIAFPGVKDGDFFAFDFDVGTAVVQECSDEGDTAGVEEVAVVVEDVQVGADVEAFLSRDDAEGFGVEGAGAPDRLLEQAGEGEGQLVGPVLIMSILAWMFSLW